MELVWIKDVDTVPMNKVQRRWVERVRTGMIKKGVGEAHVEKYEFKRFEVAASEHFIAIRVVFGRKGDEDTAAQTFCRTDYLIFVGPRGGLKVMDNSYGSKGREYEGRSARWLFTP